MLSDPQFWVLIAFVIFISLVFKPIKKILSTSLDSKIQEIKDKIEQAEKLKNDAQITLSEVKKRQNEVKDEIKNIHDLSKEKIITIEETFTNKLKDQIKKRNDLAKLKIDQMTRDANNEIQRYIVGSVVNSLKEIFYKKLNQHEKQKLINSSINELESALKH